MQEKVPQIDLDEVMAKIREEVRQRQAGEETNGRNGPNTLFEKNRVSRSDSSGLVSESDWLPMGKDSYHLGDFLGYHDHDFIWNVYRGLLRRNPDSAGYRVYIDRLRNGDLSKEEIVGRVRYSPEGRTHAIKVKGLSFPFIVQSLYRAPILGYFIRFIVGIVRLPTFMMNFRKLDVGLHAQLQDLKADTNGAISSIDTTVNRLESRQDHLMQDFATKANLSEIVSSVVEPRLKFLEKSKADRNELNKKVEGSELARLLEAKADRAQLAEKADRHELEAKADRAQLAEKADRHELEKKADRDALRDALRNALSKKADVSELERLRLMKADRADLESKADRSELENKPNYEDLEKVAVREADPVQTELLGQIPHLQEAQSRMGRNWEDLSDKLERQVGDIMTLRRNLVEQERRVRVLLQEIWNRMPQPLAKEEMEFFAKERDHLLEAFYVSFEDDFRGLRDDIKERARAYLQLLKVEGVGTDRHPIIDIGCGRGELLELLSEEELVVRGVDFNRVMVEECKQRGLPVIEEDAIDHLRSLPNGSVGAIVGLHIIEHLRFESLIDLLDESLRALKKGGLIILETPNPKNILVGSSDFYIDPTHRNPVHPDAIRYVLESRGFMSVTSYFFEKSDGTRSLLDSKLIQFNTIDDYMNVSRDYAIVGYRP